MPSRPQRPCLHPGCPTLVQSGYCEKHKPVANAGAAYDATRRKLDPALALAARIRNSAQWQKVRAQHRAIEPLCRDPFGRHTLLPAFNDCSHHIKPLATYPELAFDLSNLAGLCTACHARVGGMERRGEDAEALFLQRSGDSV
jgi:5-methylcytosine-specific restriction enzyme A